MAEDIKAKLCRYKTAPFDSRFPNQNQTRNCWQNYLGMTQNPTDSPQNPPGEPQNPKNKKIPTKIPQKMPQNCPNLGFLS
uniref:Uncharacterized protein n=1 Tax=Serinus canaria TaxID=9135 RepID=A0A8C9N2P1_SERCA